MDKIFVQIASYRDSELVKTIRSCLQQASEPDRITYGICWQFDEKSITDLDEFIANKNFRIDQVYYRDSKGCCWARNRTNRLYEKETYTLQIDSHTRFAPGWDVTLINMLKSINAEKPILTTYPPPYQIINNVDKLSLDRGIQKLQLKKLNKNLTTKQVTTPVENTEFPGKSPLIAAGMIFTLGKFCKEVEYDPEMYFSGEEISLAARAFTSGYELFYPNKEVLWHLYRHDMPLHWSDHKKDQTKLNAHSFARLRQLLLGEHELLGQYGLGKTRSLSEFETYAGISLQEAANKQPIPTKFEHKVVLATIDIEMRSDYLYWIFSLCNDEDEEIYRLDITDRDILEQKSQLLEVMASLPDSPAYYFIWPYTQEYGYGNKYFGNLPEEIEGY